MHGRSHRDPPPELCLHCTLRWLACGSHLDATDIACISKTSFCCVIWRTICASVLCPQLALDFPTTQREIEFAVAGFASVSTECTIKDCVGVVDGCLLRIKVPSEREVSCVWSFFSGHHQCCGANVQAVADHHSRFVFFAVAGPGVTKDRDAVRQCTLKDSIDNLTIGCCVIGNPAHEASKNLVPVCAGLDKLKAKHDNFNFHASQCRIRVEMAFGMMQAKWGIPQRPVGVSLANLKWMAQAAARLHNCTINKRLHESPDPLRENIRAAVEAGAATHHPTIPHDENNNPIDIKRLFSGTHEGHSHLWEEMVCGVEQFQLVRPASNKTNRKTKKQNVHLTIVLSCLVLFCLVLCCRGIFIFTCYLLHHCHHCHHHPHHPHHPPRSQHSSVSALLCVQPLFLLSLIGSTEFRASPLKH